MSEETPEQEKPVENKKLFTITITVFEQGFDFAFQCEPGITAPPLHILGALEMAKMSQFDRLKVTHKGDPQ